MALVVAGILMWTATTAGAQAPILVNVAADGGPANARAVGAVITPDGRFVAFESAASNLVSGDTNNERDVFVRDLTTGTTTRVSVTSAGAQGIGGSVSCTISDDGMVVAFLSWSTLVDEDTDAAPDIYVHDRTTGRTTRELPVSDTSTTTFRLSGDGRYIVFASTADNLVPGDTNGVSDVFLYDRASRTTTRVSVTSAGEQVDRPNFSPAITRDGALIAFLSSASGLAPEADPMPCPSYSSSCTRLYLHERESGVTTRVSPHDLHQNPRGGTLVDADISADGRYVAGFIFDPCCPHTRPHRIWVRDRELQRDVFGPVVGGSRDAGFSVDLSPDGQHVAAGPWLRPLTSPPPDPLPPETLVLDLCSGDYEVVLAPGVQFTTDGAMYVASAPVVFVPYVNVYLFNRSDGDGDGMPSFWERCVGLDPLTADDAADPDGDGVSNHAEYLAQSHPRGFQGAFLAEGGESSFFQTRYTLFNPSGNGRLAIGRSQGVDGSSTPFMLRLASGERVDAPWAGTGEVSIVVESDDALVVDRTMRWDSTGYGSHAETATAAPSRTWLLAEGATHGAFDLFYLLHNPGDVDAGVEITYLRPAPLAPVTRTYLVRARTRRTIWVDGEGPDLASTDLAARIASSQPIVVERAMYLTVDGVLFAGGTAAAAVPAAAARWVLAEGATGPYFDTFILLANPAVENTRVRVTYLLPDGATFQIEYDLPGESRRTIAVDMEDPRLGNTPFSAIVESVDGRGIVAERSMWWPGGAWQEGHTSAGTTTPGRRWAFAEGEVGGPSHSETYFLIANTSPVSVEARIRVFLPDGTTSTHAIVLLALSRTTIPASRLVAASSAGAVRFATLIEADTGDLVVERSVYSDASGVTWAAGTASLGRRLAP